jgi:hypothetical protein
MTAIVIAANKHDIAIPESATDLEHRIVLDPSLKTLRKAADSCV